MPPELVESDVFALLGNRRRRLLLRVLQGSGTPLTTGELTRRIGEREYDDPSVSDRRDVYLSLYHNHLPRLEEADVVVYDENTGAVAADLNFDGLVRALERVDGPELPRSGE